MECIYHMSMGTRMVCVLLWLCLFYWNVLKRWCGGGGGGATPQRRPTYRNHHEGLGQMFYIFHFRHIILIELPPRIFELQLKHIVRRSPSLHV